ncbi:MAG: LamG domain-containing protein [Chloroflexi bacterium]|nr:LamG domain-containing protein [Chloroflexota bacterium]
MKRKLIIITLIILGISMLSGGVLVIAGFFTGGGDITKGLVGHWKMDDIGTPAINEGLVGHWDFNGDTQDSTSYGNDAVNFGADLTTDRKGQANKAYNFVVGNTDYMEIPDSANWAFGDNDFTFSLWVYKQTDLTQVIINQAVPDPLSYFSLGVYTNGNEIWWGGTGMGSIDATGISGFGTGTWHHIVITRIGSSYYMYLNETLIGQDDTIGTFPDVAAPITLGRRTAVATPDRYFNGRIDDLRIYNRGLSQDQVTELYNSYDDMSEDSTPYSNDGAVIGASLTTDRKGQVDKAYSFNGTSDYVDTSDFYDFSNLSNDFSVSGWIYKDSSVTNLYPNIVGKRQTGGTTEMQLWVDNTGGGDDNKVASWNGSNNVYSTSTIAEDTWNHVVWTRTGTSYNFYINGVGAGSGTQNRGTTISETVKIGWSGYANANEYWKGKIDDVRIYNRALSQTEITSLYDSYNPGTAISSLQKGLVGYWKLDGTAEDSTPGSNDGTVSGTSLTTDRKGQADKAYSFDGISDRVGTAGIGIPWNNLTIGFWYKPPSGASETILSLTKQQFTGGGPIRFKIASNIVSLKSMNVNASNVTVGTFTTTADTWYHFVGVFSPDDSQKLYVNGNYITGSSHSYYSPTTVPVLNLGGNYYWTGSQNEWVEFSSGIVDDVRIYNRELSTDEITSLYDSYNPGTAISSLQKGLVGYWPLDLTAAKSDTVTADKTPYSNNGTLTGGQTYTNDSTTDRKGQSDKALNFNGSSDYISLGNLNYISEGTSNQYTISLWIKFNAIGTAFLFGDEQSGNQGVMMQTSGTGYIQTYYGGYYTSSYQVATGRWYNIVFAQNGSGIDLYVDGAFVQQLTTNKHVETGNVTEVGRFPLTGRQLNGLVDDIRTYNRALSATEITRLYDSYF